MGKSPKKAASQPRKAFPLLRVSPNAEEAFGLAATAGTPATPVSDERELRQASNAQEETSGSLPGEKNQRHCVLKEAGPYLDCNMLLAPRQRCNSGTKRKSDDFGARTKSTENEDHSIDASTARAMTSLLVSPFKKLTTEDVKRGTSKSERAFSGVEEAMVPTRNATSFMSADSASLAETAEDMDTEGTVQIQGAGTSVCTSVAAEVTVTSTIFSEQNTTGTARASPDNSVAGMLHLSPTETRRKVDTDEGDRPPRGGCGEGTANSDATSLHSIASLAHSENAVEDPEVYDSLPILAERIAQDWNITWYKRAEETTFAMTSEDLSEMASSSSESEETDAADSATPESFPEEPLPAYEFQQAPTGGQSGSYHTDISKLSSGQQSGYDGSFPSAYSSAAAVASTNVVTGSPHNVSAQKLCVRDQYGNLTSVTEGRKAERVRALYPCLSSLLDKRSERASSDQSACTSGYEKVPQNPPMQPTTGGYQQPSGATGRGSAHRSVAQWLLSNANQHNSAPQDAPQNLHPLDAAVTQHDRIPPPIPDHVQTDAAQTLPAPELQLQNDGVVTQRASSSGSDDSVPSLESLSPGQKAAWRMSQEAARLQRSTRPQGSSPPSDDSVPSLESLSPGQKAAWKLSQEAARVKRTHRPQNSSPLSDDSVRSIESLSPGQKVASKLSELAARPEQSPRPQISASASKDHVPGLEMPTPETEARTQENQRTSQQELALGNVMQREINSPEVDTTFWRMETIIARDLQTRAANKGVGHQDWPGARTKQQVKPSPVCHPSTVVQKLKFNANQPASALESLHQGMVQQPTLPTFQDDSFVNKTLPPQDLFPQINEAHEASPRTSVQSTSAQEAVMSHNPGRQVCYARTQEAGNSEVHAAAFSQQHALQLPEIQKYTMQEPAYLGPLHPPVAYASQYPVATPSNELPATENYVAVNNGREIRPMTARLQSEIRQVRRRTPLDILVSIASTFPLAQEPMPHLSQADLEPLNTRKVQSHSPSNYSFFEASYAPSSREPLPQSTNLNLTLLNGNTQVNVNLAELSPVSPMPWRQDSFNEIHQGPTTYTQPPSTLSLPTQPNVSPMGLISSPNPHFPYRETLQSPQISLDRRSRTSVAQQIYEHTQPHVSHQHSSYVQNPRESTRPSWELTQPPVTMQPFPPAQTAQTPSSSNSVNGPSYPTPLSTYHNTKSFNDYTPPLGSAQHGSSYMHPQTSLEQVIPRGSQKATSTSASYEHTQSHLCYQNPDIVQNPTVAAGLSVETTPHARSAGISSSSNLVYEAAYPPPYSTYGNSQILPNYTPYVGTAEPGNSYMHPDSSLEQAISMGSYADPGMPPSSSQLFF